MNITVYTTVCQLTVVRNTDLCERGQAGLPSEGRTLKDKRHKSKGSGTGWQPLFLGRGNSLLGRPPCFVLYAISTVERLSPTTQLIARGGQMPAKTTLN